MKLGDLNLIHHVVIVTTWILLQLQLRSKAKKVDPVLRLIKIVSHNYLRMR